MRGATVRLCRTHTGNRVSSPSSAYQWRQVLETGMIEIVATLQHTFVNCGNVRISINIMILLKYCDYIYLYVLSEFYCFTNSGSSHHRLKKILHDNTVLS